MQACDPLSWNQREPSMTACRTFVEVVVSVEHGLSQRRPVVAVQLKEDAIHSVSVVSNRYFLSNALQWSLNGFRKRSQRPQCHSVTGPAELGHIDTHAPENTLANFFAE